MLPTDWTTAATTALSVLTAHEGVAHVSAFLDAGLTRHQVAALYRMGALKRPRIGWYADPSLPLDAIRAIRVGGVLGCTSAAASYGLPLPEGAEEELQVSVADSASRLRSSRDRTEHPAAGEEAGVRLHWHPRLEQVRGYRVAVVDALLQLALCVPFEWLVAAMDASLRGEGPRCSPRRPGHRSDRPCRSASVAPGTSRTVGRRARSRPSCGSG